MQSVPLKVKAIAVRAVPYRESDMIVTLVSVEKGRLTATVRGCLKSGAKLRFAAAPFNFGEYVLSGRDGRYVVTECSQIEAFLPITADLAAYYAGFFALDALQRLSEQPKPQLFVRTLGALEQLAYGGANPDRAVTDFLLDVLEQEGSKLDPLHCAICGCNIEGSGWFSNSDGIKCCHCKGLTDIEIEESCRLYMAGECDPPHALKVKTNILLAELVYILLGIKLDKTYLTEHL